MYCYCNLHLGSNQLNQHNSKENRLLFFKLQLINYLILSNAFFKLRLSCIFETFDRAESFTIQQIAFFTHVMWAVFYYVTKTTNK